MTLLIFVKEKQRLFLHQQWAKLVYEGNYDTRQKLVTLIARLFDPFGSVTRLEIILKNIPKRKIFSQKQTSRNPILFWQVSNLSFYTNIEIAF